METDAETPTAGASAAPAVPIPNWPATHRNDYELLLGAHGYGLRALGHLRAHGGWRGVVASEGAGGGGLVDEIPLQRFVGAGDGSSSNARSRLRDLLSAAVAEGDVERAQSLRRRVDLVLERLALSPDTQARDASVGLSAPSRSQDDPIRRSTHAAGLIVRLSRTHRAGRRHSALLPLLKRSGSLLLERGELVGAADPANDARSPARAVLDRLAYLIRRDPALQVAFGDDADRWADLTRAALDKKRGTAKPDRTPPSRSHAALPGAGSRAVAPIMDDAQRRQLEEPSTRARWLALHFLRVLHAELLVRCPDRPMSAEVVCYRHVLFLVRALTHDPRLGPAALELIDGLRANWLFGGPSEAAETIDAFDPRAFELRPSQLSLRASVGSAHAQRFHDCAAAARAVVGALTDPVHLALWQALPDATRHKLFGYLSNNLRVAMQVDIRWLEWRQMASLYRLFAEPGYVETARDLCDEWREIGLPRREVAR